MPNRMEDLASKAMGSMKNVKATVKGLHGVFRRLSEEHGEASALLMRVKSSSDAEVRRRLFPEIKTALLSHESGELLVVYPRFTSYPELAPIAEKHRAEAQQLEQMLNRLASTDCADPGWTGMFDDLVKMVKHHVDEEEGRYFPEASRVLGKEEAERLDKEYVAAKRS